jgi:hypothetical protein
MVTLITILLSVCLYVAGCFGWPIVCKIAEKGNLPARFSWLKSIGFPKPCRLMSSFFVLRKYFDTTSQACVVGCMGRISHTIFKNRMVISRMATSKNHIELLVPGQIWDRIRDPGKFWSRFVLRQHRNQKFLDDDQGCLNVRTVLEYSCNSTGTIHMI